jgi:hypothetical protein
MFRFRRHFLRFAAGAVVGCGPHRPDPWTPTPPLESADTGTFAPDEPPLGTDGWGTCGTLRAARAIGGPGDDAVVATSLGPDGSSGGAALATGTYSGEATFGRGEAGEVTLTSQEDAAVWVARFEADGRFTWVTDVRSPDYTRAEGVAAFSDGRAALLVAFRDEVALGSSGGPTPGAGAGRVRLLAHPDSDTEAALAMYGSDGQLACTLQLRGAPSGLAQSVVTPLGLGLRDGGLDVVGSFAGKLEAGTASAATVLEALLPDGFHLIVEL